MVDGDAEGKEVKSPIDVVATTQAWAALVEQIGVPSTIRDDNDLTGAVALLDALLDAIRGVEASPLESLVALVGDLIENYETSTYGEPEARPAEVLRELMAANGLRQADLARELGGQSVVSAILSGNREINARQAGALAQRFKLSPAIFIAKPTSVLPSAFTAMDISALEVVLDDAASQLEGWHEAVALSAKAMARWRIVPELGGTSVERDTGTDQVRVDVRQPSVLRRIK